MKSASVDFDVFDENVNITAAQLLLKQYDDFKAGVRAGNIGKTAQFWLIYIDLMKIQHIAHTAVHENDLDMKIFAWEQMLPFYFSFNKVNYARYGSYYLQKLTHIDVMYGGLRSLLEKSGISVQAQNVHPCRVAVDQRGEQTINRDAKTSGIIVVYS